MAGNWHHFITQKLQSGFAKPGNKKVMLTWEVHKGRPILPMPRPTRDIGAADRFDAHGDLTADISITEGEGQVYHPLLDKLRLEKRIGPEDKSDALKMLANFYTRTENFRNSITCFKPAVAEAVGIWASNPKNFLMHIVSFGRRYPSRLNQIAEHLAVPFDAEQLEQFLSLPPEHLEMLAEMFTPPSSLDNRVLEKIDLGMKLNLLEGFVEDPSPANLQEILADFEFSVEEWSEGMLVLGDAPVIFKRSDGPYTNMARDAEPLDLAILPLTPTLALIGRRHEKIAVPDWVELRRASVTCAMKFFISKEMSAEISSLQSSIGTTLFSFPQHEIDEMVADIVNDTDDTDDEAWEKSFQLILG